MARKIFIIGLVWPEPTSSGAGTRIIQLVDFFLSEGFEITFASAASKSEHSFNLKEIGVTEVEIKLNDSSFNLLIKDLSPDIVLFDRFIVEEQYGWRIDQQCPNALKVLETIDLHLLRNARHLSNKNGTIEIGDYLDTDIAKREIASILRCDLSLMISEVEVEILKEKFKIDASLLYYLPFLDDEITDTHIQKWPSFEERKDFFFIGNFLHEPNWNAVQVLKTKIWPTLRRKLPRVHLNIYGAYATQKVLQLNQKKENFNIIGRAEDARDVIAKHRILLAPLQFGAGVKSKLVDAMHTGTPSMTTTIGAEAMRGDLDWNGFIEDDFELFIQKAVELYENKHIWLKAQANGIQIVNERYSRSKFQTLFKRRIETLLSDLSTHRKQNFFGQLLKYHTTQSTKYMSLWIEEKNKQAR